MLISNLIKYRYIRYCIVGLTGVFVNFFIFYLAIHYIFNAIQIKIYHFDLGFNLSMSLAIFFSCISNFILNSIWTWSDRYKLDYLSFKDTLKKFLLYLSSSSLGIGIQLILSNILIYIGISYVIAVFCGIFIASFSNFLFSNFVTFKNHKP